MEVIKDGYKPLKIIEKDKTYLVTPDFKVMEMLSKYIFQFA